jgi:hypothetical protein
MLHTDKNLFQLIALVCKYIYIYIFTGWAESFCAPDNYSTKNTQNYFDHFQSLTVIMYCYTEHGLQEHSLACQ